jgi:hypothetical protein
MAFHAEQIDLPLSRLEKLVEALTPSAVMKPIINRWRSDAAALRFHLHPRGPSPILVAVIGGTGTGKSTIVNRLIGADATATSFRRTFTTGAVAIARGSRDVPPDWLGVEHSFLTTDKLPARGENGSLVVVSREALGSALQHEALLERVSLIDTPDLDGDQPAHHAEADRAFRWAQALIFLVTPEKYQMTELLPYYRLAARYAVPSLFVMNKCEEQAVVEDYRSQLIAAGVKFLVPPARDNTQQDPASPASPAPVFTVPRNDAAYDAPLAENIDSLRAALGHVDAGSLAAGIQNRAADIIGRFEDQILAPLRSERREADRLVVALHDMETPAAGIDVNPVTHELERRLQQRSVLYLIGPQRMLDRVRQAPAMLVRLPRVAWDYVMRGEISRGAFGNENDAAREVPDFKALLSDQFSVVQNRIDDLLLASPIAQKWIGASPKAYESTRLASDNAGRIAEEELADLRAWLEKRWNATPRDTRAVQSLLKYLPGGKKLTAAAESAPYLLVIALIAHHAMFGTDLLVLGGYTLATWLTERLSNEVANRTRAANERIADRFTRLAHEQIQKICTWIDQQAIAAKTIERLDRTAADLATAAGVAGAD